MATTGASSIGINKLALERQVKKMTRKARRVAASIGWI
jgi:hypothetical protein